MSDIEALSALRQAQTGLSAAELLALPMDQYAKATGRTLGFQPEPPPMRETYAEDMPEPRFTTTTSPEPQGIDPDSDEYFLAWRQERMRNSGNGEGVGIFSGTGSRSEEYIRAARRQAGRTGWANSNVVEPPKLVGRHVNHDAQRDTRSAAERFSTPGNSFQI